MFSKQHKNLLRDIDNLEIPLEFRELNFEPSNYLSKQAKEMPMFYMTRDGFVLLMMGFTGKKAMSLKIRYIEAFNKMERFIKENVLPSGDKPSLLLWGQARLEGKVVRRNLTDTIKDCLIPAAIAAGSKNSNKLYMCYSKLLNDAFIEDPDFAIPTHSSVRDYLSPLDLLFVKKAEDSLVRMIIAEVDKNTHYKMIYQKCKARVLDLVDFLGKTKPALPKKGPVPLLVQAQAATRVH